MIEVKTIHVDGDRFIEVVDSHGESLYLAFEEARELGQKLAAKVGATTAAEAVNNAHTTRWRHMECDNEPQHIQEFRDGIQGDYGPAAGDRCEGCGRPTALYDWVQILAD